LSPGFPSAARARHVAGILLVSFQIILIISGQPLLFELCDDYFRFSRLF